jgi:enterochelin esterase-like enzyme
VEEHWINLPETIDQALETGTTREVIVVMPNAYNRFKGSMYSNSVAIGDWETFVSKELVSYIDNHYRTIPKVESRGLTGHSMGGYGTIRLGMKYPEVFSSIYMLSPCCMELRTGGNPEFLRQVEGVTTVEEIAGLSFFAVATLATAAAWAPNPTKPPFYLDLPSKDGEIIPEVAAKLAANATHIAIHQHIPNLKRLKAIAFDVGTRDMGIVAASKVLDQILSDYGIPHTFETYDGDHLNRIAERIQTKMLPFFSEHLSFE